MAGSFVQLSAIGYQDIYLTQDPDLSFFNQEYYQHTNFALEPLEIIIETARPGLKTSKSLGKYGDLIHRTYIKIELPALVPTNIDSFSGNVAWVKRLGFAIVKEVTLVIGSTVVDKHYSTWMNIWNELTERKGLMDSSKNILGDKEELTSLRIQPKKAGYILMIPLYFWFCKQVSTSLAAVALQYHDISLELVFEDIENLVNYSRGWGTSAEPKFTQLVYPSAGILTEWVVLGSQERSDKAKSAHEILFDQVQRSHTTSLSSIANSQHSINLNFNHPCKELFFVLKSGLFNGISQNFFLDYASGNGSDTWEASIERVNKKICSEVFLSVEPVSNNGKYGEVGKRYGIEPYTVGNPNGAHLTWIPLYSNIKSYYFSLEGGSIIVEFNMASPVSGGEALWINKNPYNIRSDSRKAKNMIHNFKFISLLLVKDSSVLTRWKVANCSYGLGEDKDEVHRRFNGFSIDDISIPVNSSSVYDNRKTISKYTDVRVVDINNYGLRLDRSVNPFKSMKLSISGQDRYKEREGIYHNSIQSLQHHINSPQEGLNLFSFALDPTKQQPSGSLNFSRIENVSVNFTLSDGDGLKDKGVNYLEASEINIFALGYNVFRMLGGLGGVTYAN